MSVIVKPRQWRGPGPPGDTAPREKSKIKGEWRYDFKFVYNNEIVANAPVKF